MNRVYVVKVPLWWRISLVFIVSMGLVACDQSFAVSPLPTPDPETNVLLADNFAQASPAWASFDVLDEAAYVQNGEFYLEDRGQEIAVHSPLLDHVWEDVIIQVQIRHVQGEVNNWMGVICRQADEYNYYLLVISADGYYLALKMQDGEPEVLDGPTISDAIRTGKSINEVQVSCEGADLSLMVNDEVLVSLIDDTFKQGGVALFTDAVEPGRSTVTAFDNFVLQLP